MLGHLVMTAPGFDYSRLYHQGIRVPDMAAAMAELGPALGVTFCPPIVAQQSAWLPGIGPTTIALEFTYSMEGPQHVELLCGAPGSIWDGRDAPGLHHVGAWSDDVGAQTKQLIEEGHTLEIAQVAPEDGYGTFTYLRPPNSRFLLELVSSALLPRFERWWTGGSLY